MGWQKPRLGVPPLIVQRASRPPVNPDMKHRTLLCLAASAAVLLPAGAQVIPNPSFDTNRFTVSPGYVQDNGGGIAGWEFNNATQIGLNPAGGSPLADNGAIPAGETVTFVQSDHSALRALTTTISGLTPGVACEVSFRGSNVAIVAGFSAGFIHHWQVVASNSVGVVSSPDQTPHLGTLQGIPGDLDGDGVVSRDEMIAVYGNFLSTSPGPIMTNVAGLGGPNVTFAPAGSPLDSYTVEFSTNLTHWQPLGPATPRYSFTDTNTPALPQRYYRLRYP